MRLFPVVLLAFIACWSASGQTYTISTFAGGGIPTNIPAMSATVDPGYVAVDAKGNVFFTDLVSGSSGAVMRVDAKTGVLTVVAGNGTAGFSGDNGLATSAQLSFALGGIAVDSAGNLYIADYGNNNIRKVSNGVITTVAGNGTAGFSGDNGPATSAELNQPRGIAVDSAGNLYIADGGNFVIRKVSNGVIATVAGNGTSGFSGDGGPATSAQFACPRGIAVDSAGNLYIADPCNSSVREVANGVITTLEGSGTFGPGVSSIAADSAGNLYITAGLSRSTIYEVSGGIVTVVPGNFGSFPGAVAVDSVGNLYVADGNVMSVYKEANGVVTTVVGSVPPGTGFTGDNGPATSAELLNPVAVAVDSADNVYIADLQASRIRKVSNGVITTVVDNGTPGFSGDNGPATNAELDSPWGLAVDSAGNLYIADLDNNRIRKVSGGIITTVAGNGPSGAPGGFGGDNGPATSAQLYNPIAVAVDSAGNLYVADSANNRIRRIENGIITTIAGNGTPGFGGDGGPAGSAELNDPDGVTLDSAGSLYISDAGNGRIRRISNGVITTIAGNGTQGYSGDGGPATSAELNQAQGMAVDSAGNLFIADAGNNVVRKVSNGVIATVAGTGGTGFTGDGGPATSALLDTPFGVALGSGGRLYVTESDGRVRLLTPTPGTPLITRNGVVPIYSSVPTIQSGSWVSIYGSDLASGTSLWNGNFPISLGGTSVNIDNKPAYLWFVSPTQINLQVPDDTATGTVSVAVTTLSATVTSTVTLAPYGPSLSLLGDGKHVAAEIATSNGTGAYGGGTYDLVGPSNTFSYSTRPVKAGETLTLYGVGFGPTTPHVPAGQVFSGSAPTNTPVTITIGGMNAPVAFSGITEAGLYQINVTVPAAPSGDQPLSATVNSVQTPLGPVVTVQ